MRLPALFSLVLLPTMSWADPTDDLLAAQEKLLAAITRVLDIANHNCSHGNSNSCQDALVANAQLNIVKSEMYLEKLDRTVRSSEIRDMIDEAASSLNDVRGVLDEIQEKLDE